MSLWQTPQACTLTRTSPAAGSGISRSTISKSAPGLEICAAFIGATSGSGVTLIVAISPPIKLQLWFEECLLLLPKRPAFATGLKPPPRKLLPIRPECRAEGLQRRTPTGKDSCLFRRRLAATPKLRRQFSAVREHLLRWQSTRRAGRPA